jgi:branched-chain amino acid transport system ATP-binding protein
VLERHISTSGPQGGAGLAGKSVSVHIGGVQALEEVDVELDGGELLGLIGPNGAGKTTLVNVLSGFQRPTTGRVLLDGTDITDAAAHLRARFGVMRTFQQARLFPALTVLENVELGALGCGSRRRAAADRGRDLIEWARLTGLGSRRAGDLPHGVAMRVGILRALAAEPSYLLLDEPAAGLNEAETDELAELLCEIPRRRGCGVLLIEHDTRLVLSVSDRVHVLDHGRTLAVGSPAAIRSDERVIEAYLGAAV